MPLFILYVTPAPNNALTVGHLLVVASQPQNAVFSGLLATGVATLGGSVGAGVRIYGVLLCLYAIAATYNNLADIAIDSANKRTDNPFASNQLGQRAGQVWIGCNLLAVVLLQLWSVQPVTVVCVLTLTALIYAYSQSRLNLQSRGLVAPIVLSICYASLPYLLGASQVRTLTHYDYTLAGLNILLCMPLLLAKDYKDLAGDKAHGKLTPLVRYGARTVGRSALLLCLIASAGVVVLAASTSPGFVPFCLMLLYLVVYVASVIHLHQEQHKRPTHFLRVPQLTLIILNLVLAYLVTA